MKFSSLFRWVVAAVLVLVVSRTVVRQQQQQAEDAAPPVPEVAQQIVLQGDQGQVPFVVERLNVYLTEDEKYPESFEFEGTDLSLVGMLPAGVHVGYEDNWQVLVGKTITLSRSLDEESSDSGSHIRIPGEAVLPVVGGEFTIQEVGEGRDAKTPLRGEIRLRCATPAGEREYRGTFQVNGTTWG